MRNLFNASISQPNQLTQWQLLCPLLVRIARADGTATSDGDFAVSRSAIG